MNFPDDRIKRALIWLLCWLGTLAHTKADIHAEDAPRFQTVVNLHFDRWNHGEKGTLVEKRIRELVLQPEVRGTEAAAIASIHCYQRKAGIHAQPLTREFLMAIHHEDSSLRRDQAASGANLSHNDVVFLKHIESVPRKVFAVEKPSLAGIAQGHLGDCYFIAGVGAHALRSPDQLRQLIHPRNDNSFDVRFPDGKQVHVPPMTDAQLALGSSAGNPGTSTFGALEPLGF